MIKTVFNYYHGHFYFTPETMTQAEIVRQKMVIELPQMIRVFNVMPRAVGPHPLPMFEFHFRGSEYDSVKTWLEKNRAGHSVFIHPLSGNEAEDHTLYAEFLGGPVFLNVGLINTL